MLAVYIFISLAKHAKDKHLENIYNIYLYLYKDLCLSPHPTSHSCSSHIYLYWYVSTNHLLGNSIVFLHNLIRTRSQPDMSAINTHIYMYLHVCMCVKAVNRFSSIFVTIKLVSPLRILLGLFLNKNLISP